MELEFWKILYVVGLGVGERFLGVEVDVKLWYLLGPLDTLPEK